MISVQELLRQGKGVSRDDTHRVSPSENRVNPSGHPAKPPALEAGSAVVAPALPVPQDIEQEVAVALEVNPDLGLNQGGANQCDANQDGVNEDAEASSHQKSAAEQKVGPRWLGAEPRRIGRRGRQQRRWLGLFCLGLGYTCLGWALQDFRAMPAVWLLVAGGSSFWGIERARQWHTFIPAMVASLALISILLPIWVLGLLTIPIVGFFGCVLLMKEQSLETALLSSLFVYSLSAVAASVGALGLGFLGGNAWILLLKALQILAGFLLLSLFTGLHRRRFYGLKGHKPAVRFALRSGLISGLAILGLAAGFGLNLVNWPVVMATTSQFFQ